MKKIMKTIWVDYAHEDGEKRYETKVEALAVIKDILSSDVDILNGRDINDISDYDLFEIGDEWYHISAEEIESNKCCDDVRNLEYDDDGYTDGVEIETWKCTKCQKTYRVPIEIVRDFDEMYETKKPWSKFQD